MLHSINKPIWQTDFETCWICLHIQLIVTPVIQWELDAAFLPDIIVPYCQLAESLTAVIFHLLHCRSDVLLCGHQRSNTAATLTLLQVLKPRV